jgi:hypothetical protein
MRIFFGLFLGAMISASIPAYSQTLITIKEGESIPIGTATWMRADCSSLYKNFTALDMLEGPPELKLTFEPGKVSGSRDTCTKEVDGGTIIGTARGIKERTEARLTYRVRNARAPRPTLSLESVGAISGSALHRSSGTAVQIRLSPIAHYGSRLRGRRSR